MRRQNQRPKSRSRLQPDDKVAELIASPSKPVLAANHFSFGAQSSFIIGRCRVAHQTFGNPEKLIRLHLSKRPSGDGDGSSSDA